eukprot:11164901-Alexandrium_andersonii.AAC.1
MDVRLNRAFDEALAGAPRPSPSTRGETSAGGSGETTQSPRSFSKLLKAAQGCSKLLAVAQRCSRLLE